MFEDVFATRGIPAKVSLQMGYIGTLNSSDPLGVTCKHGTLECLGNAHQLCLHKHLSLEDFYANVACQNYQSLPGEIGHVEYTKQCAKASSVDWEESGVGRCIEHEQKHGLGKEARGLLRDNVRDTAERNVSMSCTIVIASTMVRGGERRCVVDGGVWTGCDVSLISFRCGDARRIIKRSWTILAVRKGLLTMQDGHTASDFVRVIEAEYENLRS